MGANLVLINGLPGTGKSTLAQKLRTDLGYPMLGKDMLKEWLFDTLGELDKPGAKLLGKSAAQMLYILMTDFLSDGRSIIIENAFHAAFDRDEIKEIIAKTNAQAVEIYCTTEYEENKRRFNARITDGTRHAVHIDTVHDFRVDDEILKKYEQLAISEVIKVDTTHFDESDYMDLLQTLRTKLD